MLEGLLILVSEFLALVTVLLVPSAALNRASLPGGHPITKPDGGLPAQPCPHRASRES